MDFTLHEEKRKTFVWVSYGLDGMVKKERTLDEISNKHLDNIILHIFDRIDHYGEDIFNLMINEEHYRIEKGIYIEEYQQEKIGTNTERILAKAVVASTLIVLLLFLFRLINISEASITLACWLGVIILIFGATKIFPGFFHQKRY